MEHIDRQVLLLNTTYEILDIIPWQRAISLIYKDRVKVHEEFEDSIIRSPSSFIKMPSILVCYDYVGFFKNAKKIINLNKKNVLLRDDHTCMYCTKKLTDSSGTIDHIIPQSRGGRHSWDNVVAACLKCNSKKDDYTLEEANLKLVRRPFVPTNSIFFRKYLRRDEYSSWRPFVKEKRIHN